MRQLLSVGDALQQVLGHVRPLAVETVALSDAAGRVLAGDARAAVDLPPFPSSAMDGFALRAADGPGPLRVVDNIAAGRPSGATLGTGEAMTIATGGVLPAGADVVVPLEVAHAADGKVSVPTGLVAGSNVRPTAGDVRSGAVAVAAGAVLSPARIAALAATGVSAVEVRRRPRAVIVTTGTELRQPGESLGPGEIYESNGVMLDIALSQAGAIVDRRDVVADDADAHRTVLAAALEADLVVSSGGVSVGPHDLVRATLAELGVDEVFWGVAMRPGKPIAFGTRAGTLVFGLPGNPVSSLVGFALFVAPAVAALQGAADPRPRYLPGTLSADVVRSPGRDDFVRARSRWEGDRVMLDAVRGQESHMIVRGAAADALVLIPRGDGSVCAGSAVRYLAL